MKRLQHLTSQGDKAAARALLGEATRRRDLEALRSARSCLRDVTRLEQPSGMGVVHSLWGGPDDYLLAADKRGDLAAWSLDAPQPRWRISGNDGVEETQWHLLYDPDPMASAVFLHRSERYADSFRRFFPQRTIDWIDLDTGARRHRFELPPEGNFEFAEITLIALQGGGRWLVVGTDSGFCVFDTETGARLLEEDILDFIALIPLDDGHSILVAFDGFERDHLEVWDLDTLTRVSSLRPAWLNNTLPLGVGRVLLTHADDPPEVRQIAGWSLQRTLPSFHDWRSFGPLLLARAPDAEWACVDPDTGEVLSSQHLPPGCRVDDAPSARLLIYDKQRVHALNRREGERARVELTPPGAIRQCLVGPRAEIITLIGSSLYGWSPPDWSEWIWSWSGHSTLVSCVRWGEDRLAVSSEGLCIEIIELAL